MVSIEGTSLHSLQAHYAYSSCRDGHKQHFPIVYFQHPRGKVLSLSCHHHMRHLLHDQVILHVGLSPQTEWGCGAVMAEIHHLLQYLELVLGHRAVTHKV